MIDPNVFDNIAKRIVDVVPESAKVLKHDLDKNVRAIVTATFAKLDLVTREEFDIQKAVLARTREKIEQLEARVVELAAILSDKSQKEKQDK